MLDNLPEDVINIIKEYLPKNLILYIKKIF